MTRPVRTHTEVMKSLVPLAGLAVDIGAGSGALAARLMQIAGEGRFTVIAVDPQADLLPAARRRGVAGLAAVGEALPLADGAVDMTIYANSLHHVPVEAQAAALDEAVRITRPGGHVVVREPLAEGPRFELMRAVEDETEIRAAAIAQLARLPARAPVRLEAETDYEAPTLHRDFEDFRAGIIAVDPERAGAVAAIEAELRAGYAAISEKTEKGDRVMTPSRIWVFARLDG
ncbi:MAG: methyltransferase domain-containing protein [Rhodospirillaceae bacterium]|nr:methyltransferase domain-containing protein [Rhodospirillaceae bacterium]